MRTVRSIGLGAFGAALSALVFIPAAGAEAPVINPPPTAADYAALGELPDWSGTWVPDIADQNRQIRENPTPWNAAARAQAEQMFAEMAAGTPRLIFHDCLPENHPSFMLISHNAMEILFTPGRVTKFGESDLNRLRRIYTDGRSHPNDHRVHPTSHWEPFDEIRCDTRFLRRRAGSPAGPDGHGASFCHHVRLRPGDDHRGRGQGVPVDQSPRDGVDRRA